MIWIAAKFDPVSLGLQLVDRALCVVRHEINPRNETVVVGVVIACKAPEPYQILLRHFAQP